MLLFTQHLQPWTYWWKNKMSKITLRVYENSFKNLIWPKVDAKLQQIFTKAPVRPKWLVKCFFFFFFFPHSYLTNRPLPWVHVNTRFPLDSVIIHLSGITPRAQEHSTFSTTSTFKVGLPKFLLQTYSKVSLIIVKYMSALSIIAYLLPSPSITFQMKVNGQFPFFKFIEETATVIVWLRHISR